MSFTTIAQRGIDGIRKNNQQHQMPLSSLECFGSFWKKKNCTYGLHWTVDRKESIDFIEKLSYTIDKTSKINVMCDDPFVTLNLESELEYLNNVRINDMNYDLSAGNPEFYGRNSTNSDNRVGTLGLRYDSHIKKAVKDKSGKFKDNGPFITDLSWFQGEQGQGAFRRWLFSSEFGLKNIIILDNNEFDVSDAKGLCMLFGEDGYDGTITVKNLINNTEFIKDFRKIGTVIINEKLADLLPTISTDTKYNWARTNNLLKDIPEVKGGDIKVLGSLRVDQEPTYYYTDKKYIKDWTDINEERFATRYQPATSLSTFYKIAVGTVVPPGDVIPGALNFTYVNVESGTGIQHKEHLMSDEVSAILKETRTGKSLHAPQTIWIPYATEFKGFTKSEKEIISKL